MASAAGTAELRRTSTKLRKSPFFTILGLIMLVFAIAGFWPQYFVVAIGGTPLPRTQFWLIHLHAAVFTLWLLMYISQASLIASGRARVHIKLGPWLAGYGLVTALIGLFAAGKLAARLGQRVHDQGEAAAFVFFPLVDMVFFAGFLVVAIASRKKPAIHKRAMLLATFSIAVVGGGRFIARIVDLADPWFWQPLMLSPLLLALCYDILICRKLYAVMVIGLGVHTARLNADLFTKSEWWLPIGRELVAPFS